MTTRLILQSDCHSYISYCSQLLSYDLKRVIILFLRIRMENNDMSKIFIFGLHKLKHSASRISRFSVITNKTFKINKQQSTELFIEKRSNLIKKKLDSESNFKISRRRRKSQIYEAVFQRPS